MFIKSSFDNKENKLYYYRGKDCIEKLCTNLKKSAMEIINCEKERNGILTHEENNFYNEQEICYVCKENFSVDKDDKHYINRKMLKIIVIIQGNLEELPIVSAI